MMTNKILMQGSSISVFIFLISFYLFSASWCYQGSICNHMEYALSKSGIYELVFFLTIPLFLLSLITYRMKDEVFRAWWGFARWWVPVIIAVTILLENAGGGGTLGMNNDFTAFILIILYSILIIVSLVKIVRAYFAPRR